jgi:hypothetical protein
LIITATGWTWDEVDNFDLVRYAELAAYWEISPPVHLLVAGFMGYKAKPAAGDLGELLAEFGTKGAIRPE